MRPSDLVLASTSSVVATLAAVDELHWNRTVAAVGWSCRDTIEHLGGDYLHYAGQVAQQAADHYVAFSFDQSRAKTHDHLVETVDMSGRLLAAAVSFAPRTSVARRPDPGMVDRPASRLGALLHNSQDTPGGCAQRRRPRPGPVTSPALFARHAGWVRTVQETAPWTRHLSCAVCATRRVGAHSAGDRACAPSAPGPAATEWLTRVRTLTLT